MNRKITSFVQTDLGRKRNENEDNFVWVQDLWNKPELTLIGAIDGVGGYEGGAEAAEITKTTIENYLQNFSFGAPLQLLKEAIINANNKICEKQKSDPTLNQMSCVLSVAILDAEKEMMYVGHVGDSRGYLYRGGSLLKVTKDHSSVGMKEDAGYLTEEEAMHHPRRNEISKMLGERFLNAEDSDGYIDRIEHSFLPFDIALFCSDGLTDLVTQAQMKHIFSQEISLEEKVQMLIDKANELGGKDNITVALADYKSKKSETKKVYKRAIEVPIAGENIELETPERRKRHRKKKGLFIRVLPILTGLLIGFLANWKGTKSFLLKENSIANSIYLDAIFVDKRDSIYHDTLFSHHDRTLISRDRKIIFIERTDSLPNGDTSLKPLPDTAFRKQAKDTMKRNNSPTIGY
jgi:serine/threonine protein phosphatase PrpC